MNRRTFVSSLASASALAAVSSSSSSLGSPHISRPAKVGLIGCGWFGNINLDVIRARVDVDVVSLCDVNGQALENTAKALADKQGARPKTFADYSEMLKSQNHDVVVIATPDHWHALMAIEAMKAGADLLLEKPISVDVIEGEAILAAARKYGRIVQVNTQRRSSPIQLEAKAKYIDSERLGKVGVVESFFYGYEADEEVKSVVPPEHLDYEMWAGPAPKVDYIPPIANGGWRRFMEYGNGYIGDMGVHMFDMVRMLLDLSWPDSISSSGGTFVNKMATGNCADTQRAVFNYPDLTVSWEHRMWGKSPIPPRHWSDDWGARFIGSEGTLTVTLFEYIFESSDGSIREGRHHLSKTGDLENVVFDDWEAEFDKLSEYHKLDLFESAKNRSQPNANAEEGHISSACCILANLALDLGRTLSYDPQTRTVIDDPEATARLSRPYRKGWVHPNPETV